MHSTTTPLIEEEQQSIVMTTAAAAAAAAAECQACRAPHLVQHVELLVKAFFGEVGLHVCSIT
jgi:hypothetical protein